MLAHTLQLHMPEIFYRVLYFRLRGGTTPLVCFTTGVIRAAILQSKRYEPKSSKAAANTCTYLSPLVRVVPVQIHSITSAVVGISVLAPKPVGVPGVLQ